MTVRVQQTQFAAGHGGLHVGRIDTGNADIAWSFDSGTYGARRIIDREIAEAARRLRRRRVGHLIDVHFISHFHEDHVKGLPTLTATCRVGCIVAPLIEPWERLAQLLGHPHPSDFTIQLAADPATALAGLTGTVLLVPPGGGPLAPAPTDSAPTDDVTPTDDAAPISPAHASGTRTIPCTQATFTVNASGTPIWILAPYVTQRLTAGRPDFVGELARRWRVPIKQVEKDLATPSKFLALTATSKQRTELREAYLAALRAARLPRNQNWTSLTLYSGPYGTKRRWRARWADNGATTLSDPREGSPWAANAGWLHTGDACLDDAPLRRELSNHYGTWLDGIGTLQAPHHGSGDNWSSELTTYVGLGGNVVVAGVPGFHGWPVPAKQVVSDVAGNGSWLVQVTDDPGSRFSDTWVIGDA